MQITVLIDNNTMKFEPPYPLAQAALSFYIEENDKKILFDVGYSDIILQNAEIFNIDLRQINSIVISHSHNDHTNGLNYLLDILPDKIDFLCHPNSLCKHSYPDMKTGIDIGFNVSTNQLIQKFNIMTSKNPLDITDNLIFLGEIPRTNDFETQNSIGEIKTDEKIEPDFVLDDTALVYKSQKGLVIITGCAHAGICNTIEYAKKVTGINKVHDVIGGFHLLKSSRTLLEKTKSFFKKLGSDFLHPCHCTDLEAKIELSKVTNVKEVEVGTELNFE